MCVDFGSCLDHLFDDMCQMNPKIGHITRHQSLLRGFASSPSPELDKSSSNGGDDDDDDDNDASCFETDDKMTSSQ